MTLSILEQAVSDGAHVKNLRGRREDPAAQAINTLDANHDGAIQPEEVAQFAASQGLDVSMVRQEFAGLDSNGDGMLSTEEVGVALRGAYTAGAPAAASSTASESEPWAASADRLQSLKGRLHVRDPFSAVEFGEHDEVKVVEHKKTEAEAAQIAEDLNLEASQEHEARELFRKSTETRQKLVSLTESTKEKALDVGASMARHKTNELMKTVGSLSKQALEAEEKAAALRAKSKQELAEAQQLMAVADAALRRKAEA